MPLPAARAGGGVCVGCHLTVNPGGIVVSVVIEIDVTPEFAAAEHETAES